MGYKVDTTRPLPTLWEAIRASRVVLNCGKGVPGLYAPVMTREWLQAVPWEGGVVL